MKVHLSDSVMNRARNQSKKPNRGIFRFTLHDNPYVSLTIPGVTRKQATVRAADTLNGKKFHTRQVDSI